jgi:death-on-curing protein
MRRLGESPQPLRDEGLLESALMRPRMADWYENADLIQQAALLTIGISQAQAFVDGNKRTAFATLDAFLWVNGWEYVGEPLELARRLEQVAAPGTNMPAAIDDFAAWLRANVRERADRA